MEAAKTLVDGCGVSIQLNRIQSFYFFGCAESSLLLGLGFSLGAASRGYSLVKVHGLSCSAAACGIFPDQGSKPCPFHYKANS